MLPERVLAAATMALALAPAAGADTYDATFVTLAAGRQDPRDGDLRTVVPAYQLVSLRGAEIRNPWFEGLGVVLSGWGALDFAEVRERRRLSGDLDLLYAEGDLLERRLSLRAGRQLVAGGAARITQLDGASARFQATESVAVAAWGGAPVAARFETDRGDVLGGGRVSWRASVDSEAGVSFVQVMDDGRVARQDLGLDARWAPSRAVSLSGYGLWSTAAGRLAEFDLTAALRPWWSAEFSLDWRRSAPDLFLSQASIFSVFSEEGRDEAGTIVSWRPLRWLSVAADYHFLSLEDGDGHRGGARAALIGPAGTVGAELRRLALPGKGYLQARLFDSFRFSERLATSLDLEAYLLDQPLNGEDLPFTATVTVSWLVAPGWRVLLGGVGGVTPFFARRVEFVARLVHERTLRVREEDQE